MNKMVNELEIQIRDTIDSLEIFDYPKKKIIIWFIENYNNYYKKEYFIGTEKSYKWGLIFDVYEYFLPIILSKNKKSFGKKQGNININFIDFCFAIDNYRLLYQNLLFVKNGISNLTITNNNIYFNKNYDLINKNKFKYLGLGGLDKDNNIDKPTIFKNVNDKSKLFLKNTFINDNKSIVPFYLFEELFEIKNKELLNIKLNTGSKLKLLDIKNSLINIFTFANQEVFLDLKNDNLRKNMLHKKILNKKDIFNILKFNILDKNFFLNNKQLKELINIYALDINKIYNINNIDFKKHLFIKMEKDNYIYSPYFVCQVDINRLFYSIVKNTFDKNFEKYKSNDFLEKFVAKFNDIHGNKGRLIFQKKFDMKVKGYNGDIDYSIYDKKSGTLMIFEGKNFLPSHSSYDVLKMEFKNNSPLEKAYKVQYHKLKNFFNNINNKPDILNNLYGEQIAIKKVFYYTLTGTFDIGIKKYGEEDYKVINYYNSIKIIEKKSLDELFSNINILADYDFYLKNVAGNYSEKSYKINIKLKKDGNTYDNFFYEKAIELEQENITNS